MPQFETLASLKGRFLKGMAPTENDFAVLYDNRPKKFRDVTSLINSSTGVLYYNGSSYELLPVGTEKASVLDIITTTSANALYTASLTDYVTKGQTVEAGAGTSGGGDLSSNVFIGLQNISATVASTPTRITVDAHGRITGAYTQPSVSTIRTFTTTITNLSAFTVTGDVLSSADRIVIDAVNVKVSGTDVWMAIQFCSDGGPCAVGHNSWFHYRTAHTQSGSTALITTMTSANIDNTDFMSLRAEINRVADTEYVISGFVIEVTGGNPNWFTGTFSGSTIEGIKLFAMPTIYEFKSGSITVTGFPR